MVNHPYNASNLGLSFGDVVARWNSEYQYYDKNFYVGISPWASDFDLEPNWGYWVFSGSVKSVELCGHVATETQIRPMLVPGGGGGWSLVGLCSDATLYASDLMEIYSGGVAVVAKFNAGTGTYQTYYAGIPFLDFQLMQGDGLWLWCNATGSLIYEP